MAACSRMPIETGAPGCESGLGAICVGGNGGGVSAAAICCSEMCLFTRSEPCACELTAGRGDELCGSCAGLAGWVSAMVVFGVVGDVVATAVAGAGPDGAVATRYWFQVSGGPPAWWWVA